MYVSPLVYGTFLIRLRCRLVYYRGTLKGKVPKLKLISVITKFCCRSLWLSRTRMACAGQCRVLAMKLGYFKSRVPVSTLWQGAYCLLCELLNPVFAYLMYNCTNGNFYSKLCSMFCIWNKSSLDICGKCTCTSSLRKMNLEQGANWQLHRKEHIHTTRCSA